MRVITPRLLAAATVVLLSTVVSVPTAALAQTDTPSTTLDLTLNTGPGASSDAPEPSAKPASARAYDRRSRARSAPSSRGFFYRAESPSQMSLGMVSVDKSTIRKERDNASRLLSVLPQGSYLAITGEQEGFYAVLMIDRSTGWIPKDVVQIIDYKVALGSPDANRPPSAVDAAVSGFPTAVTDRTKSLLQAALTYLGVPYRWAGTSRNGLDCSGFVQRVFSSHGIPLPRVAADQSQVGVPVQWSDLQAGDRIYFDMGHKGRISHTGIYLGRGYFIHASTNQGRVGVDSILRPNYYRALVGARRSGERNAVSVAAARPLIIYYE